MRHVKCTFSAPITLDMTAEDTIATGYVLADEDDVAHTDKYHSAKTTKDPKMAVLPKTPQLLAQEKQPPKQKRSRKETKVTHKDPPVPKSRTKRPRTT